MKREVAAVLAAAAPKKQVISVEYVRLNRAKRTSSGAFTPPLFPDPCRLCWPIESGFIQEDLETPGRVFTRLSDKKLYRRQAKVAGNEKIRVRLKSYEHTLIDAAAEKIVDIAKRNGAEVSGPIPLPTEKQIVTILRAVHKYKDSREQFEQRTHKRLIEIRRPSQKAIEALMNVELPAGVDIDLQL